MKDLETLAFGFGSSGRFSQNGDDAHACSVRSTDVAAGAGRALDVSERFGVAPSDQGRIYAVAERLLCPGGRVFCGVHLQNFFEKHVLRRTVVDGDQLCRTGELLFAEEQVTYVGRSERDLGIADHVQVRGARYSGSCAQQRQEELRRASEHLAVPVMSDQNRIAYWMSASS